MAKKLINETIVLFFIVLFAYAGAIKLTRYSLTRAEIRESPLFHSVAGLLAWLVPSIELVVAVMLLIPRLRLSGLYSTTALMIAFTLYIGILLVFSEQLPCSCGGIISGLSWKQHMLFNLGATAAALTSLFIEKRSTFSRDGARKQIAHT